MPTTASHTRAPRGARQVAAGRDRGDERWQYAEVEDDAGHGLGAGQPPHADLGHRGEEGGGEADQRHRLEEPRPGPQDQRRSHEADEEGVQSRRGKGSSSQALSTNGMKRGSE